MIDMIFLMLDKVTEEIEYLKLKCAKLENNDVLYFLSTTSNNKLYKMLNIYNV